jgi:FkbM family methyltransferase
VSVSPSMSVRVAAQLLRRLHPWSGLARITNLPWLRKACSRSDDEVVATLRNGIRMPVRVSDFNGRMLFLFGQTDPKVIRVCQAFLGEGDVFLDIGANHGEVGLLCADVDAVQHEVHLFEPIPELARKIADVIDGHDLRRVRVHSCGLGRRNARLPLVFNSSHTGKAKVMPSQNKGTASIEIPIRSVEDVLGELAAGRRMAAKVDVEGGEGEIVPALLDWPTTRFVVFEWEHLADGADFRSLVHDKGFELYGLEKRMLRPRLIPAERLDESISDVVAIRGSLTRTNLAGRRIDSLKRSDLRS